MSEPDGDTRRLLRRTDVCARSSIILHEIETCTNTRMGTTASIHDTRAELGTSLSPAVGFADVTLEFRSTRRLKAWIRTTGGRGECRESEFEEPEEFRRSTAPLVQCAGQRVGRRSSQIG